MDNFIEQYTKVDGEVHKRTKFQSIKMKIFAGSKRVFDISLALIGIIILSPLFLIISIAIRLDSKGPALFKQTRIGKHGKPFTLYKFRSMVIDNDVHDLSTADRYTKVGRFIRKTSLDELPQLFCVVKNQMSLIGPRPWIEDYYTNMTDIQKHRCDVRPGITGLAQVKGRNNISVIERINYDLEYIEKYSLSQDLKIIFLTLITLFKNEGLVDNKKNMSNDLNSLKEGSNKK